VKLPSLLVLVTAASACAAAPVRERWAARAGDHEVELDVRHAPRDAAAAAQVRAVLPAAVALAERWGPLRAPVTITIHPSHDALEAAADRPGHAWLRAWARPTALELQSPRTWSRGAATDAELTQLLAHELTHCVMFQAVGDARVAGTIPVWFREGMATSASGERFAGAGAPASPAAAFHVTALAYRAGSLRVYAGADEAFRALEAAYGRERIRALLAAMRAGRSFDDAFREATGASVAEFEARLAGALEPVAAARG
jgi:hypothetical protein